MQEPKAFLAAVVLMAMLSTSCNSDKQAERVLEPVRVKTFALNSAQGEAGYIQYTGTLRANNTVQLSFLVSGNVISAPVEEGQFVKRGQLLASVDETAYRSQYEAQMAQVRLAEENYNRTLEVYRKGSIAEIKMLEARSQYDQARAAAKATYQNIAYTKLHAPLSGYIGSKSIEAGAMAAPGTPAVEILDISSVTAEVPVPEAEINTYKKGEKALVVVEALANRRVEGTVEEVAVLAASGSPNYIVKVSLPNPREELKPGMVCSVTFPNQAAKASHGGITIPVQAVQVDEKGQNFVFVASPDGNQAVRKSVRTGSLYNNGIEIIEGLAGSESLIVSGYHKLTDNAPIQIVE